MNAHFARTLAALTMLALFLVSASSVAFPQSKSPALAAHVAVPDTPPGQVLKAWLGAFNSGDNGRIRAYFQKYQPDKLAGIQWVAGFHKRTGGFDLLKIVNSDPSRIDFLVKERNSERRAFGEIDLARDGTVEDFALRAIPKDAPTTGLTATIDAATRARVIDKAIAALNKHYVFPKEARQMADAVQARRKRGEYASVTSGFVFAKMLTKDFRDVSDDKHLHVSFNPAKLPPKRSKPTAKEKAEQRQQLLKVHCGFEPTKRLPGNIGYLKFNFFADPEICGSIAKAEMQSLAGVSALIIDLRENGGGTPKMIDLLASYLFAKPTHLNDMWNRDTGKTTQHWTSADVPGKRLVNIPVYVLTSHDTFSGAEEFSYDLQNLKRATIVGEVTGGGAHMVAPHRIGDHFTIGVPFARAINPITKTNWEDVGVQPDVKVPADKALAKAEELAAAKIASK